MKILSLQSRYRSSMSGPIWLKIWGIVWWWEWISKKLWLDSRARNECAVSTDDQIKVQIFCNLWRLLCMEENASFRCKNTTGNCRYAYLLQGMWWESKHTWYHLSRYNPCFTHGTQKGIASSTGPHPFTCDACEAYQHGKSSQLLHKLWQATKLKHPRSEQNRAGNSGISHKFCSKKQLVSAL